MNDFQFLPNLYEKARPATVVCTLAGTKVGELLRFEQLYEAEEGQKGDTGNPCIRTTQEERDSAIC
jgi:hypothetical protein